MSEPKTDFEKVLIANLYIRYLKKRITELEDKADEIRLLELKIVEKGCDAEKIKEKLINDTRQKVRTKLVRSWDNLDIVKEIEDWIFNSMELRPNVSKRILYFYNQVSDLKGKTIRKCMKHDKNSEHFNIGTLQFHND